MTVSLTVHRGTQQIGGSCIEIAHPDGDRLILDAGRPLDAPDGATGLLPTSLDRTRLANVLISHPHQDHWGLVEEIPPAWPIWTGSGSAKLIAVTGDVTRRPLARTFETWDSRSGPFSIGPFIITPMLTDHSAFDAYMLVVETAGKRILYTGDFRRHGRKSTLVDRMMAKPPADIDVLLTEGTNLGSDKPVKTEEEVERDFVELFKATKGRVFVSWSGQNIDRTVTLYRAAKRTNRTLAIDLYVADVLDRIAEGTGLPRPGFPNLKVVVTRGLGSYYRSMGREGFVERMVPFGISAKKLVDSRHVIMLRRALIGDYQRSGVVPTADDAYNFSMWRGYLSQPYHSEPLDWCKSAGASIAYIHTSGHASPADLRAFAAAVHPKMVVPVHGIKWDEESHGFGPVRRLADGETMVIP
ncbi:MAG: MBL fold metallo-hydrolase [Roseiarcus sp.]|uniref:MBL fold metallo-hydrolase n=1 Tax=Roseiarcus sp. TaxID=1969460 RepID=UPI003C6A3C5C